MERGERAAEWSREEAGAGTVDVADMPVDVGSLEEETDTIDTQVTRVRVTRTLMNVREREARVRGGGETGAHADIQLEGGRLLCWHATKGGPGTPGDVAIVVVDVTARRERAVAAIVAVATIERKGMRR